MKSWQTTVVGALLVVASLCTAIVATIDSDPNTVPDWNTVAEQIRTLIYALSAVGVLSGIGFWRTRDNDKTSERVGAK